MSLDRNQRIDLADARTVRIGGVDFHVPPLSLRQIIALADGLKKLSDTGPGTIGGETLGLFVDILVEGLRRAYPQITRDDILDLPTTTAELARAVNVVIEQGGGRRVDADAGELAATSASTPSTGVSSSPISA